MVLVLVLLYVPEILPLPQRTKAATTHFASDGYWINGGAWPWAYVAGRPASQQSLSGKEQGEEEEEGGQLRIASEEEAIAVNGGGRTRPVHSLLRG